MELEGILHDSAGGIGKQKAGRCPSGLKVFSVALIMQRFYSTLFTLTA